MALSKEEQAMLDMLLNKQKNEGGYVAPQGDKLIHVIQVLDASTSMDFGKEITISSFNENLDGAKASPVETTVTLVQFASEVDVRFSGKPAKDAPRLTNSTYVPNGMTALYDAIGQAINTARGLPRIDDANTSVLLQIFTDGDENQSQRYNASQIKSMIEEMQATGRWTVTVMGPKGNVNIYKNMGIYAGNIATFTASSAESRRKSAGATLQANTAYYQGVSRGIASSSTAYSSVLGSEGADVDSQ